MRLNGAKPNRRAENEVLKLSISCASRVRFTFFKFLNDFFLFYLFSFQVFLDHREEIEIAMLVTAKTHGATPLVVACRNGHYDVAEYLIQRCNADIEQPGSGTVRFSDVFFRRRRPIPPFA